MAKDFVAVNPTLVKWARETAGFSVAEVAEKLKVKEARVEAWETGEAQLTQSRLDALATAFHRPTALFFMSAPPTEDESRPTDFRSNAPKKPSPGLIFQIRFAKERRETALDLFEGSRETPPKFAFRCRREEEPPVAAKRLRKALGVSYDAQAEWKKDQSGYAALNGWKEAAESIGVLVFQAPRRDMNGARGFSIHGDPLPVMVLSSEDTPTGRCFTLAHELAHLGLRDGGLCDLHDGGVELFCNRVAACVLMPEERVLEALAGFSTPRGGAWPDSTIRKLARQFSVSEQALLLRLLDLKKTTADFYQSKHAEFSLRGPSASGQVPQHVKAIASNGRAFTKLVLDAYHRGDLTQHRASTYLRVGHQHMPKIEEDMSRHAWRDAS